MTTVLEHNDRALHACFYFIFFMRSQAEKDARALL